MLRYTKQALLLLLATVGQVQAQTPKPTVPETLVYCGITLQFTPAGRAAIQKEVDKLTANTTYYQQLAQRAALFMPHITDAFAHIGVPADLQYIAIQESGLRADAVSSSQAVGFWQFKDYTALEVGLVVTGLVDERKHITRASIGAARYFFKKNLQFNNWIYAVIAYQLGGTGALPHVKAEYLGAKAMLVDEHLYWYAQKAIAHKIAFEPALAQHSPKQWLEACSGGQQRNVSQWLAAGKIAPANFGPYNRWAQSHYLPVAAPYTYFVLRTSGQYAHRPDPNLANYERPEPPVYALVQLAKPDTAPQPRQQAQPPKQKPQPKPPTVQAAAPDSLQDLALAPWYNHEFTFSGEGETIEAVAERMQLRVGQLLAHNRIKMGEKLPINTRIFLLPAHKVQAHVVLPGEGLAQVAALYKRKPNKLAELNGLAPNAVLLPGQRLHLRAPKPAGPLARYRLPGSTATQTSATVSIHTEPTHEVDKPDSTTADVPKPVYKRASNTQPLLADSAQNSKPAVIPQKPTTQPQVNPQTTNKKPSNSPPIHRVSTNKKPATNTTVRYVPYVVQKGESLYSIAEKFGMSVNELMRVNKRTGITLHIGTKLLVRQQH